MCDPRAWLFRGGHEAQFKRLVHAAFQGEADLPFRDTRMETFIVSSPLYVQELGVRPRFLCYHEGSFHSQDCQKSLAVFG